MSRYGSGRKYAFAVADRLNVEQGVFVDAMKEAGVFLTAFDRFDDDNNPVDVVNNRIHHFVGPTVHLEFGKLWWSAGLYADLNNMNNPYAGEIYGPVWIRTVLGLSL